MRPTGSADAGRGCHKPADPETARRNVPTGISKKLFDSLGRTLTAVPEGSEYPQDAGRVLDAKRDVHQRVKISTGRRAKRWRSARCCPKAMACACRAGFRARHLQPAALRSGSTRPTERKYVPLSTVPHGKFEVLTARCPNTACSALNMAMPCRSQTLVLWEAQFGDFANGAQIMIDQYIAQGESKWLRANGLVMLLPHGYEGQGPEHSSARLERFLQLCAQDNIQVATSPRLANYFHVLRRQMHRPFRKPLIIMTPKSLLRHKLAVSPGEDFIGEAISCGSCRPQPGSQGQGNKRVVLCSGKVAYDLMEARDAAGR
jgi:2-oxoglutarate dehydrogenase E1 component